MKEEKESKNLAVESERRHLEKVQNQKRTEVKILKLENPAKTIIENGGSVSLVGVLEEPPYFRLLNQYKINININILILRAMEVYQCLHDLITRIEKQESIIIKTRLSHGTLVIIDLHKLKYNPPSQTMEPVKVYACVLMGWKYSSFNNNMNKYGSAYHWGKSKIGYFELKGLSTIDIDTEEDFKLAEKIIIANQINMKFKIKYLI